jgi:hypothetical protein
MIKSFVTPTAVLTVFGGLVATGRLLSTESINVNLIGTVKVEKTEVIEAANLTPMLTCHVKSSGASS